MLGLWLVVSVSAQADAPRTKFWKGGSGDWSDAAHWSLSPDGEGGAGVPRSNEDVVIAPDRNVTIRLNGVAWCNGLLLDGTRARVTMDGPPNSELNIAAGWRMIEDVLWPHAGTIRLHIRRAGTELDPRGVELGADVVLEGGGSWSVLSDLVLRSDRAITLKQGTLIGNGCLLKAGELRAEGRSAKRFIGGGSMLMLDRSPAPVVLTDVVEPGTTTLVVDGNVVPWDGPVIEVGSGARDVNVCGTGPGQTPFILTSSVTTDYNGFGVRCRNECNATVTVSVSQGVGPFTYLWLNGGPPTQTWVTACGGPQIVLVTDEGQNVTCFVSVTVTEPDPLGVIFFGSGTPPTCPGVCNGSRTALGVGGVSPISYDWNNGAGTGSSFFQLCPGLNTLSVTDANGCQFDTTFFFNLQPLQPALLFTPASCFGVCDGTAQITPAGGTQPYTVLWAPPPPNGQGTNNVSGLCPGNWSVTITDFNGCDTTVAFVIDEPPAIIPDVISADASCFGVCDGTATVTASGAPGPFTYTWAPAPGTGQGTGNVTGLCAGSYQVTILDQSSGCDSVVTVTIDSPNAIQLQGTVNDASCATSCDGSIQLAPTGGQPPYTYSWTPPPPIGQGTASISGLCAGPWTVTVTDNGGCDTTVTFTIIAPPPLDPGAVSTDVSCAGACDGTAGVSVSGGTPTYTYLWAPAPPVGQGTPNATGLCAGPWSVTISDLNGCDSTVTFTIVEPPPLVAVPSQNDVSCGGVCDGTASVAVSGGTPTYSFVWTPAPPIGQGTPDASGLCAGAYSVLITDANGCELTVDFVLDDPAPITASLQIQDANCPEICDGSAGVIAGGGTAPYTYLWQPAPGTGQGTPNASGLCPQAYSLTISDALGCDTTIAFTIGQPVPIDPLATVTDVTCAGDCDGSIALAPTGGTGSYSFLWSPAPPVGQGTATASGLCAGFWSVTITSGICDTTITLEVLEPPPIDASLVSTDPTCAGDCDGSATVTASGGTPPLSYAWSPAPPVGQGTPSVSGLCAGAYSVIVADALGCDTTINFVIQDATPIAVGLVLTEAGCDNACAGTATATPSGGVPPYTYVWSPEPGGGQGSNVATGLCAGFYDLAVSDASGCDTTIQLLIVAPSQINAAPTSSDASCSGVCDGAISLVTTGGVAPYAYLWTPAPPIGQGTANVSGLCAGDWLVQISDAAACDTFLVVTINEPLPIEPNGSSTDEDCNGPCNGTASVSPVNGTAPYSYVWSPVPPVGQGTPNASGLCPGDWSVTITDAGGCDTTVVLTVLPKQGLIAEVSSMDGPCAGECGGSAGVIVTVGAPPFGFAWSPAPPMGQGTANVSGLCPGIWQVTVTDSLSCDTTIVFQIDTPPPFDISLVVIPENCAGPCTGSANVTVSGGTAPIGILWQPDPGGGQGTPNVTGLCAGTPYTVTFTDANGCDSTLAFTVDPFQEILPNSSSTPASCATSCDGSATVGPTGGVAPYTYVWSPEPATGQGTPMATGFCAGPVEVTITDANGCSILAPILILAPAPLVDDATVVDLLCSSVCEGSITLNLSGGVAPYVFAWSPEPPIGQGTNAVSELCAGDWSVTVTDGTGCDTTFTYTVIEPAPLDLSATTTQSECQVCSGTAQLLLSGGTPFFVVLWTDAFGNAVGFGDNVSGLCAGIYFVNVTDGNGCTAQLTVPITDQDGEVLTMLPGTTSCPGICDGTVGVSFTCSEPPCTIAWADSAGVDLGESGNSVSDLCPGDYLVTVTNVLGCISIATTSVTEPPGIVPQISSTPVLCADECTGTATIGVSGAAPPYTFTWDPPPATGQGTPFVTGLCAGVQSVEIGYSPGCSETFTVLILEPSPLVVDDVTLDVSCAGLCDGSIAVAPSGGTAPYSYFWSPLPSSGQGTNMATGLCAGDWSVTVTDANGCSITLDRTVIEPLELDVSATSTPSNCLVCNGTASALVSGGTAPFAYAWSLGGMLISTDADAVDLCSGLYFLNVTDASGCSVDLFVQVPDANAEALTPQNGQVTCATDCDGTVSVDLVCSAPPCTLQWTDGLGTVVAQNVLSVSDLCVGDYTVQVTNADGCVSFATASITPGVSITPNLSSTPVSCSGICDGSATVGPTGGSVPYQYVWDPEPGGGQGTPMATGLCAGIYSVVISDAINCDTTITVLILEPQPLSIVFASTDPSCNGVCEGSIIVNPQGGVAPYAFDWSPMPGNGQGTGQVTDLCAGAYDVTVTDANGCSIEQTIAIGEPDPLVLTGSSTQSECGLCNGSASVSISGGTMAYQILWTQAGQIQGTGTDLSDLCAGIYLVEVMDAQGCTASILVPVTDVEGEETITTDGLTTCAGGCDGSVSVAVTCSDPPCTIAWFDDLGNDLNESGNTVIDLCAGMYLVMVTNATGCITVDTAFVAEPDPIAQNLSTTPVTCNGACDGTATVGPTGGAEPYTYFWDPEPPLGQGTPMAEGLCAGTWDVTITDTDGCSITIGALILEPAQLVAVATVIGPTCNGLCDGAISLAPTGGTAPYAYLWTPEPPVGQGTNSVSELCAGQWSVLVSDAAGCDSTFTFDLLDPPALVIDLVTTDNVCHGDCQGTAEVLVSGGVAPYLVTWLDDQGGVIAQGPTTITGLCAGDYILSVSDASNCSVDVPFTITEGMAINAGLVVGNETCTGPCDGTAEVQPTGGSGPYTILWVPDPPFGQGTTQISGLCAGSWTVTITDALNCDTTVAFMVMPFEPISDNAVVVDVACNGDCSGSVELSSMGGSGSYTYVWTPEPGSGQGTSLASGLCPGPWTVLITDGDGCDSTFTYTINEPPVLTAVLDTVIPASCSTAADGSIATTVSGGVEPLVIAWTGPNGWTSDQEDPSGLLPGEYSLIVTDANNCTTTLSFTVDALIPLVADAGPDQELCAYVPVTLDGSLTIGGVDLVWTDDQGSPVGTGMTVGLGLLQPGVYTYTLTATDGPCSDSDQVMITVLAQPLLDAGLNRSIFLGGTATLGGSPTGPPGSTFLWSPDSVLSSTTNPNPVADPLVTTWFVVTVTAPNGCVGVDSVLITVIPEVDITSGFTPNGDGWNDVWVIDFIDQFPNAEVEIYNRWGELLFQSVGYRVPWDGRYAGGFVPVGTYYYVVKLNDPEFPDPYTGPLTVIR